MAPAATARANLNNGASSNNHRHHRRITDWAIPRAEQLRVAMGAEEVDNLAHGDFVAGFDGIAAIQTRHSQPAVFLPERHGNSDGRKAIDQMFLVHETVIATRAAHFERKYSLVRRHFDPVEAHTSLADDTFYIESANIGEIVTVYDDDRAQCTRPKASDCFQSEFLIRRRFPITLDFKFMFELFYNGRASPDMASGA